MSADGVADHSTLYGSTCVRHCLEFLAICFGNLYSHSQYLTQMAPHLRTAIPLGMVSPAHISTSHLRCVEIGHVLVLQLANSCCWSYHTARAEEVKPQGSRRSHPRSFKVRIIMPFSSPLQYLFHHLENEPVSELMWWPFFFLLKCHRCFFIP